MISPARRTRLATSDRRRRTTLFRTTMSRPALWCAVAAVALSACGDGDGSDTAVTPTLSSVVGQPYPSAELTIRHQAPQADLDVSYTITCSTAEADLDLVDGGSADVDSVDVDARSACEALGEAVVVDWLLVGSSDDEVCTEQFGGDDTATIDGVIETAPIDVAVDRRNGCGISTWDDLLDPILPPAIGITDAGT